MRVEHPFEPVFNEESRTLILGSLPSVKSREVCFYYGNPRNRFWPMLFSIYGEEFSDETERKKQLILDHHLALWDVIASCEIHGSSDASIRNAVPVDIGRILSSAKIVKVICNGATAGRLYTKWLQPVTGIAAVILPSASPANAAWTMDKLTKVWQKELTDV